MSVERPRSERWQMHQVAMYRIVQSFEGLSQKQLGLDDLIRLDLLSHGRSSPSLSLGKPLMKMICLGPIDPPNDASSWARFACTKLKLLGDTLGDLCPKTLSFSATKLAFSL